MENGVEKSAAFARGADVGNSAANFPAPAQNAASAPASETKAFSSANINRNASAEIISGAKVKPARPTLGAFLKKHKKAVILSAAGVVMVAGLAVAAIFTLNDQPSTPDTWTDIATVTAAAESLLESEDNLTAVDEYYADLLAAETDASRLTALNFSALALFASNFAYSHAVKYISAIDTSLLSDDDLLAFYSYAQNTYTTLGQTAKASAINEAYIAYMAEHPDAASDYDASTPDEETDASDAADSAGTTDSTNPTDATENPDNTDTTNADPDPTQSLLDELEGADDLTSEQIEAIYAAEGASVGDAPAGTGPGSEEY